MSRHTPGPWRARLNNFERWEIMYASGQLAIIANPDDPASPPKSYAECGANARLIAAAPDLLEALEMLWREYKALADSGDAGFWSAEDTPEGITALAAIARATQPLPPQSEEV